jgi:hypothetical protein
MPYNIIKVEAPNHVPVFVKDVYPCYLIHQDFFSLSQENIMGVFCKPKEKIAR